MCSEPGNIACTTLRPSGVSATQGSAAWMAKKTAPLRRTALSTSDNASIETSADAGARAPDARSFARGRPVIRLFFTRPQRRAILQGPPDMVNTALTGRCFCGEVQFEVTGQPAAM